MNRIKGFIIAGTHSGSGKTTVTLGIMAWLRKKGYGVAPFKVGPDFIDPGHHTRITGTTSRNLDGWMLSKEYNLEIFHRFSAQADIAVIEGVMGLYDGFDGKSEAGSTAQMAKWLDLPVILVVNAKSMARSAAALIKGFIEFDPDLNFAGVVFNNLGSKNHYNYLADAMKEYVPIPLLGGILRDSRIEMPERHLGLVTNDEHMLKQEDVDLLAEVIGKGILFEEIISKIKPAISEKPKEDRPSSTTSVLRIGVARDAAFCFYYQDNLDILESLGATIVFFSPLTDETLPENLAGLYFGGGYPEEFAAKLSENKGMCEAVKKASSNNMPIYGECGGFMYLCSTYLDKNSTEYAMTKCFPFSIQLLDSLKALGYREVSLTEDTFVGTKEMRIRGHEFHYSEVINSEMISKNPDIKQVYSVSSRKGGGRHTEGFNINQTLGSYVHLHFGSNPEYCGYFVHSCRKYITQTDGE